MPDNWAHGLQEVVGKDWGAVLAIIAGSLVRLGYKRNIKLWVAILNIVSMTVVMVFVGPPLADYFNLGPSGVMGIGMVFGMFGADVIRGLFRLGDVFAKDPASFVPFKRK